MPYPAKSLLNHQLDKTNTKMPQQQFEQLRMKILELTPQQLLALRSEIEGKLDDTPTKVTLTEEELQTISRLFQE